MFHNLITVGVRGRLAYFDRYRWNWGKPLHLEHTELYVYVFVMLKICYSWFISRARNYLWKLCGVGVFCAWLDVLRTPGFAHKPQVMWPTLQSRSTRLEFCSYQSSSVMHALHRTQDSNPRFPPGRHVCCYCTASSVRVYKNYRVRFVWISFLMTACSVQQV